ncbi:MAG TPA: glycosyltransferase [Alphaproteobacteria bacterium]|nr:glycosyltransferase [Alphaproteobacteria bacterium]
MSAPPVTAIVAPPARLDIVVLGLSITSSWGNGHAVTYRGLLKELARRGHSVTFLERDVPWYAANRDLPKPPYAKTYLYKSIDALKERFAASVRRADLVIVGSFVPDGIEVGGWVTREARGVTAFYDIDTPVTLARLEQGGADYIDADLIRAYDLYLSFTGGPVLDLLERRHGAQRARALYCSVDPSEYFADPDTKLRWDCGYMGTYSDDRQPTLSRLLVDPARRWKSGRFVVAGPKYPTRIRWPANVQRIEHLAPRQHRAFYNAQRYTLNVTRADMVRLGWSPSVRLFEAAACGTAIVSDWWDGLDSLLRPDEEILIARNGDDMLRILRKIPEHERRRIGIAAQARVLAAHTAAHRAAELEEFALAELRHRLAA